MRPCTVNGHGKQGETHGKKPCWLCARLRVCTLPVDSFLSCSHPQVGTWARSRGTVARADCAPECGMRLGCWQKGWQEGWCTGRSMARLSRVSPSWFGIIRDALSLTCLQSVLAARYLMPELPTEACDVPVVSSALVRKLAKLLSESFCLMAWWLTHSRVDQSPRARVMLVAWKAFMPGSGTCSKQRTRIPAVTCFKMQHGDRLHRRATAIPCVRRGRAQKNPAELER